MAIDTQHLDADTDKIKLARPAILDMAQWINDRGTLGRVVDSISALKAIDKTKDTRAFVTGYYAAGDGGGGAYWYDSTDTTSADNGGTIIVATDGGRWKLSQAFPVSVKQFGAKGDGTTADTVPFQKIIAAHPGGGRIYVPNGYYRITATLTLHSGLTFIGASGVNMTFGTPTNAERPAHIFIDAALPLFANVGGVQLESVTFSDLSLGARLFPTTTTVSGTTGIQLTGSYPIDAKKIVFERVTFHDFAVGINVNDPNAGGANPDWNCAPVTLTDCFWYYCDIGVRINADNADMWLFQNCAWFQNVGDIGIYALRSGTMTLINCFGGGGIMLYFNGGSRDATKMIGCQFEAATAMLVVDDTMASQQTHRPITLDGCVVEADVVLYSTCHVVSIGSRYVNTVTIPGANVVFDSNCDSFIGGGTPAFNITGSGSAVRYIDKAVYRSKAGSPVNTETPLYVGEEFLDTSTNKWYKAYGLAGNLWAALN